MKINPYFTILLIITICLFSAKIFSQGPKDPGGNPDDSSRSLITKVELPQPLLANTVKN